MRNKILVSIILLVLLVTSCAAMKELPQTISGVPGTAVITEFYASKTLWPGDTWKVYLKASDPKGGMRYIAAVVFQPGQGQYPISWIRISPENAKELSGYIYLNTNYPQGYDFLNFETLTLTVQIKDDTGYSRPVNFSLYFYPRATRQEPPPPGVFQEQGLGPIMVTLVRLDSDLE